MKIIAIGGGEMKDEETLPIDVFVVELTLKDHPRALFIPTASGDEEGYCETFDKIYGRKLGCQTDHLKLLSNREGRRFSAEKIKSADLIYVGGGNTLRMMKIWRKWGVDLLLYEAARKGTVLCGISAGAICWHTWGHSDSQSFSNAGDWSYIRVRGLGLVPHMFCPHLDGEKRQDSLKEMIRRRGGLAVACDNNAAVFYHDGTARCISTTSRARAYIYRKSRNGVSVEAYNNGQIMAL